MKKNILTNKISIILLLQITLIFLLQFETYSQNQIIKGNMRLFLMPIADLLILCGLAALRDIL